MIDLKPALRAALSSLPAAVPPSWPLEEFALPVITVTDESSAVLASADGAPYLEEGVWSVTVLSSDPDQLENLSLAADQKLTALGLRRTGCQDSFDENARAWQKALSYRAVLHGDTIYSA